MLRLQAFAGISLGVLLLLLQAFAVISLGVPREPQGWLFGYFPDRSRNDTFTLRLSPEADSAEDSTPDYVHITVSNEQGVICAQKYNREAYEISELPCNGCMKGKLQVEVQAMKGKEILFNKILQTESDESRRAEICSLEPEMRKEGENITITYPKETGEAGCRFLFLDADATMFCCFSNLDYFKVKSGACDPGMQSVACRKELEAPVEFLLEGGTCKLQLLNLRPSDTGNILYNYDKRQPRSKKILNVENHGETSFGAEIVIAIVIAIGMVMVMVMVIVIFFICPGACRRCRLLYLRLQNRRRAAFLERKKELPLADKVTPTTYNNQVCRQGGADLLDKKTASAGQTSATEVETAVDKDCSLNLYPMGSDESMESDNSFDSEPNQVDENGKFKTTVPCDRCPQPKAELRNRP